MIAKKIIREAITTFPIQEAATAKTISSILHLKILDKLCLYMHATEPAASLQPSQGTWSTLPGKRHQKRARGRGARSEGAPTFHQAPGPISLDQRNHWTSCWISRYQLRGLPCHVCPRLLPQSPHKCKIWTLQTSHLQPI